MNPAGRQSWESEYGTRGGLWGGAVHFLPDLPPGSRVLELGCGNGKTLAGMMGRGWDITATDFSLAAVQLCRGLAGRATSCELLASDARHSPFRPETFDAVIAFHLLGHLDGGSRALAVDEIHRILRPGGCAFFLEFSVNDLRYGRGTLTEPGTFVRGTGIATHYFTLEEVRALFSSFPCEDLVEQTWTMRIRGCSYLRSEIRSFFKKQAR